MPLGSSPSPHSWFEKHCSQPSQKQSCIKHPTDTVTNKPEFKRAAAKTGARMQTLPVSNNSYLLEPQIRHDPPPIREVPPHSKETCLNNILTASSKGFTIRRRTFVSLPTSLFNPLCFTRVLLKSLGTAGTGFKRSQNIASIMIQMI